MENLDNILRNYDLEYLGNGKHKITFEKMMELKKKDKALILDVRSKEENELVNFNFASNIPINEIPDRKEEIPLDKTIVIFCTSTTRATFVSLYLQLNGYKDVKILAENISEIASHFKPGYALKNKDSLQLIVNNKE